MAKRNMPVKKVEPLVVEKEVPVKPKERIIFQVANCFLLNVREGPTKTSKVLFKIRFGTTFFVEGMVDDWFFVRLTADENKTGYILSQYTSEV